MKLLTYFTNKYIYYSEREIRNVFTVIAYSLSSKDTSIYIILKFFDIVLKDCSIYIVSDTEIYE